MAVKGLVLAGGGARGSYQVGVKQALDELGFRPDVYTGTSVGCLNGALFALGMDDVAQSMWSAIGQEDVIALPEKFWGKELVGFVKGFAENGGMDVAPLEKTVRMLLDEEKLRSLPVGYGLVTVHMDTLQPLCLSLEEIPEGKLADYMMASAACFPALRPHTVDGERYIDGGYYDNMPIDLAARLGAEEIVAVDLDSFGFTRRPKAKDIRVRYVECYWPLGNFLHFDPEKARRNMQLGYLDTYKAFKKLKGCAYAFRPECYRVLVRDWAVRYRQLLERAEACHPAMESALEAVCRKGRTFTLDPQLHALYGLELTAEAVGMDPCHVWADAKELCAALTAAFLEKEEGRYQFAPLLLGEKKADPLTLARALTRPDRLICEAAVLAAADLLGMQDR